MNRLYTICILTLALQFPFFLFGQNSASLIRGNVAAGTGRPIEGASVMLFNSKTNILISSVATDSAGYFSMKSVTREVYLVIRHVGYISFRTNTFSGEPIKIKLLEDTRQLSEVAITSQKELIEHQLDRLVVNVGGDSRNGINALDVFRKIPGLSLNGNEIMFEGKQVAITIDGRSTKLTGADLYSLLNTMPTTGLAQIEVLFSPSAKFDAAGSGGIINLKRLIRERPGYDITTGITLGHGWKYLTDNGVDASVNVRKGSNYWSGSYGFGTGKRYQEIETNTNFLAANQLLADSARYVSPAFGQNLRMSWDHYFSKKNVFGILITAYANKRNTTISSSSRIFALPLLQLNADRLSETENERNSRGSNVNLNLKFILDSIKKKEITMDADAGIFSFKSKSGLNVFDGARTGSLLVSGLNQKAESPSAIFSYKADYVQMLYRGILEGGVKGSYTVIDNSLVSSSEKSSQPLLAQGSNDYDYREGIMAAYVSTRQVLTKFSFQLGLRSEYTITRGNSHTLDSVVHRNYLNLFPNMNLGYKFSKSLLSVSYARRIERPSYNYLNPFDIPNSAYTSTRGNPYLKPSFSDNYRIGFNPGKRWSFSVSYSLVKDVITDLSVLDDRTQVTTSIKANMNSNKRGGISVSYSNQIFKIWDVNYSVGSSVSSYRFNYSNLMVHVRQLSSYASLDNRIALPGSWWLGIFFYGQSRATYGNRINQPYYMINVSAGKKLFDGRGNFSINCNDIFFSSVTRSSASYGNVQYSLKSRYDSRNVRLAFSYSFGSGKVDVRKRSSGSVEEQRRNQS